MTTIVFPTLSRRAPMELEWGLKSNCMVHTSDLSGDVQSQELPGARWTASFRYNALEASVDNNDAGILQAFLAKLRGQANRAAIHNFKRPTPLGTWAGAPAVNNESGSPTAPQVGNSLICNGFDAGATVMEGDFFSVNSELKMITAAAAADGAGNLTLTFEPALRASPAHGAALSITRPTCLMILSDPHIRWSSQPGDMTDFALDLVEVWS